MTTVITVKSRVKGQAQLTLEDRDDGALAFAFLNFSDKTAEIRWNDNLYGVEPGSFLTVYEKLPDVPDESAEAESDAH